MSSERIKYIPINEWSFEDQPRGKLINKGCESVSDVELLALLIGSGCKDSSAIELARLILNRHNNDLNNLAKADVNTLKKYRGIGEAKAVTIVSALELSRRRSNYLSRKTVINTSISAYTFVKPFLSDKVVEEFWILLLDQHFKYIEKKRISIGGISNTTVDPRVIFKEALLNNAVNIIMVHNHPSGKINPSDMDIKLTTKLKSAANFFDINISDHIIFGDESYFSFSDNNLL